MRLDFNNLTDHDVLPFLAWFGLAEVAAIIVFVWYMV